VVTLSIIIVNYNVKLLLRNCLACVSRAIENISAEVIIVDNASSDNSISYLQPMFPQFTFVSNNVNVGFARANNQALALATGHYILFLNPDTIVPSDCFNNIFNFFNTHPDAGALGVKMINAQGGFLKESKRGFPSPLTSFYKMTGLTALFPHSRVFAKYYLGHLDANSDHAVDILSGAFMMVRKEVLDKTGGFDEQFFMFAEDIDLSYRILLAGYKNYYFAGTTIVHYKGASTNKDVKYVRQFYKAMSQFVTKYYGNGAYSKCLDTAIGLFTLFSSLRVFFSSRTSRRGAEPLP
jgi:GT2 family glycosyltransferase